MSETKIEAKCIFGHKFTLTEEDHRKAQELGCAICPKCSNPATVTRITAKSLAARTGESP